MHDNTIEQLSVGMMPTFKDAYEAAAIIARYCEQYTDCKECSLRPLCNNLNGGSMAYVYAFRQVKDKLEEKTWTE